MPKYLESFADISSDGLYRYSLLRRLSLGKHTILFVGLNPSTADGTVDDATVRRCVGFAQQWGFNLMLMGNLYAFRGTNPIALGTIEDPVGPRNDHALKQMIDRADVIVAAWGRLPYKSQQSCYVKTLSDAILLKKKARCLGWNRDGSPKHPLYVPKSAQLVTSWREH
jgi:hypothetical protein